MEYILIFITAVFVNNVVLSQFLGICPFLGVSKKVETAMGMGAAVTFVLALSTIVTFLIQKYVLDAYLERIDLFKKRYPSLYLKDKYLFCLECIHIFKLARMQKNVMVMHDVINKRSKITFSAKEMLRLPIKAKIYVLYSKWSLKLISTLTL